MSGAFRPCGLITLITDFGRQDPFVGVMKGAILGRLPDARIVDLTHDIAAFHPEEAGFWLERSFGYFPAGCVHLAVVDPGVGTSRRLLVALRAGHAFLAPDNGLLDAVLRSPEAAGREAGAGVAPVRAPGAGVWSLDPARDCVRRAIPREPSATFHGRDLLGPLAAELAAGRLEPAQLGEPVTDWTASALPAPSRRMPSARASPRGAVRQPAVEVSGVVVTIDRYGNLITNIEAGLVTAIDSPRVLAGGRELALGRTYADAGAGECLGLINSFGVLEIACHGGNAALSLGLNRAAVITVRGGNRAGAWESKG